MAILGAAALLLFGPEQLPKVLRKVGQFTREVQNTSQSFIREMERAAEPEPPPYDPYAHAYEPPPYDASADDAVPYEAPAQAAPYAGPPADADPYEPPEPAPSAPAVEKLAEPRGAPEPWDMPTQAFSAADVSAAAKTAPEDDHPVHI